MARNKRTAASEGGGGGKWLTTFNDMMTLLLTFFVLLLSMGSLEGGKTKKMYTEFRAALGVLGMGEGGEYEVVKPIVPILKVGKRRKIVKNLYRTGEEEKGRPGEDALRKKEPSPNVVVREIPKEKEAEAPPEGGEGEKRVAEPPPLPPKMLKHERLRMGAAALKKEVPGVTYRFRDEYTVAISVPQTFLFDVGKAEVKPDAERILRRISAFLAKHPELDVVVEGHTDNTPIHTPRFPSNWELSVARAVRVLEILQKESGLPPERFAAAGFGDLRPVAPNDTPEGRARNRRVEIVLTYGFKQRGV